MPPLAFRHDVTSLIYELGESIPAPIRSRFYERVSVLLAGDASLSPGKVVEAAAQAQRELLIAPEFDEPPRRPSKPQPPRGPWRRRA
jgi:hypothetical protein